LIGGLIAMISSEIWGRLKSAVGRAVFFLGFGLFCWGFGETIWSYYNFFEVVAAPYPSLADIVFAPSIFFYGLGAIFLAKATGAKFGLRNKYSKVFTIIAPFVMLAVCYYVLIIVARGGVLIPDGDGETMLKVILDIVYPVGDFLSLTVAIIVSGLSFKYLGGKFQADIIFILLGLGIMFLADTAFSYTTTVGTYYNGNVGDMLLTLGLFSITFGTLGFCVKPKI